MKTKIEQAKKPKNTSQFSDRVKIFSENVEKLLGEKIKPAEYTIVEVPPIDDVMQLKLPKNPQYTVC